MSKNEELIISLVEYIRARIETEALRIRREKEEKILSEFSSRGMSNSGSQILALARLYIDTTSSIYLNAVADLASEYRKSLHRDPDFFYTIVEEQLISKAKISLKNINETLKSNLMQRGGLDSTGSYLIDQIFSQQNISVFASIRSYIQEEKLKGKFNIMSTAEDRRALGIPDVAVMMWFPDNSLLPEAYDMSQKTVETIKKVCAGHSSDQAVVRRFDDPDIVAKEQITPAVEQWLRKSLLVICDFSGNRANVYYEFGHARACGVNLIGICRKSEFDSLHSHVKNYPLILFDSMEELESKLEPKIREVFVGQEFAHNPLSV